MSFLRGKHSIYSNMAMNQKQTPLSNISTYNCIHFLSLFGIELITIFQDGMSVFRYPYNPSIFLQYVKYTKKINIAKGIIKFRDKYKM